MRKVNIFTGEVYERGKLSPSARSKTDAKYNVRLLDKKNNTSPKVFGLDWLTMAFLQSSESESRFETLFTFKKDQEIGGFLFISEHKTGPWNFRHRVYYEHRYIGDLFASSKHPKVSGEIVHFKVDNEALYNRMVNLKQIIEQFIEVFSLEFTHVVRADTYIDFYKFNQRSSFKSWINNVISGKIMHIGREGKAGKTKHFLPLVIHSNQRAGRSEFNGVQFGARNSSRYIRVYNKTFEMEAKQEKPYIRRHWELNGISDVKRDVFRFELEMKTDWFKQIKGFQWHHLFDRDAQFELLELGCKGFFEFVYNDFQVRNDRKQQYIMFEWDKLRELPKFIYDYCREKVRNLAYTARQKVQAVRSVVREYVLNRQSYRDIEYALIFADKHRISKKFYDKVESWIDEFSRLLPSYYQFDNDKFFDEMELIQSRLDYDSPPWR